MAELEEIQAVEVEPLVCEAADEPIVSGIIEESIHLQGEVSRIGEASLSPGFEECVVGRGAPQEVGEARGEFVTVQAPL